jgi:acetyl esterase/lipase
MVGDSNYVGAFLEGGSPAPEDKEGAKKLLPYFDVPDLNIRDPVVSPAYTPSVLAAFPPSLLISGTRDIGLSPAVYTHAQLVTQGVDGDLHVWEGAAHCSFAQPIVDPSVPESREAWDVIWKFFDSKLGK